MDPIGMAQTVYGLARQIYVQVEQAKANKSQCQRLAERVRIVETAIRGLNPEKPNYASGLQDLVHVLESCLALVQKFSNKKNWFHEILQADTNDASFQALTEELQKSLQVLNLGLVAQQIINQDQDRADVLADTAFIQSQQQEIIRLNQENLACIQGVGLQAQEQHQVILLQLASMRAQLGKRLHPKPVIAPTNTHHIPYYDLAFQEKIATGSFASVYRGTWEGQAVAIKTLSGTLSLAEQAQFEREVLIMSGLRHPQITTFYGSCLEEGQACLVTEYMSQGTLSDFLKKGSDSLLLDRRLALALDIAKALNHLHQKGILHRDLKSANVLVNDQGAAKLSDFGLSKTAASYVQTTHERSQALAFQAPECFVRQGEYSPASDVYSFGVILWEIMTGKYPAEPSAETRKRGTREIIPSEVPAPVAELIKACWSLKPSLRPNTQALAQSLEDCKRPRPVSLTAEQWFSLAQDFERAQDFTEASKGYLKASQKGHVKANTCLGMFFMQGPAGIRPDKGKAYQYFLAGAAGGHHRAMYNLARMFEKGDGIAQDYGQALAWYEKAYSAGNLDAASKVEKVHILMTTSVGYQMNAMTLK